jgi:hypothetical protein
LPFDPPGIFAFVDESALTYDDPAQVVAQLDYTGDEATKDTLIASLMRLPEGVRVFALDRCHFVAAAHASGDRSLASSSGRHRILLQQGVDDAGVMRAIGEVWLNQHSATGQAPDAENDVDELVAQWQFTGPGGDA